MIELRLAYQACAKAEQVTDSRKESAYLRGEMIRLLMRLQTSCTHEHVAILRCEWKREFAGDDAHSESRTCLWCALIENAWGQEFKNLVRPKYRFNRVPLQVAEPLLYLLSETIQVAEEQTFKIIQNDVNKVAEERWLARR